MDNKYYLSQNQVTVIINNKSYSIPSGGKNFELIKDELGKDNINWERVEKFANTKAFISDYCGKNFDIKDNVFYYKNNEGVEISTSPIITRILESAYKNEDIQRYLNFFDKILTNPSESSREELFIFLKYCNLPIVEDGDFLAYKVVNSNYRDCYSNNFDNSIGKVVQMERSKVDDKRQNTCSSGLHFCSKDYIKSFISSNNHLMVIKINPQDVVSIPDDYNNTKGRCCKYQVIGEVDAINIPELKDIDYKEMLSKLNTTGEVKPEIKYFEGNQKDFFKFWSEPRNTYTTYILKNSNGETAYKFIGGTGQKCFKKVDMPEIKESIMEFKTKSEALKFKDKSEGLVVKVGDKSFTFTRSKCNDGYTRWRLV